MSTSEQVGSYYELSSPPPPPRPALSGFVEADVVIIGGGLAGLCAAVSLLERGPCELVLLDARRVGWGASGRNSGLVAPGFTLDPWDLVERVGRAPARALFELTKDAVRQVRARIARYEIPCGAQDCGVIKAFWTPDLEAARQQQDFLHDAFGVKSEMWPTERTREVLVSQRYHHALYSSGEALQLQPLEYARGLAGVVEERGGRIYEGTAALRIETDAGRVRIFTERGELRARQVLCASGGDVAGLLPDLSRALLPLWTYLMTTQPLGERLKDAVRTDDAVFDSRIGHDYYRTLAGGRLLFGGGLSVFREDSQRTARRLLRRLLAVYPQLDGAVAVERAWGGCMDWPRHQMPMLDVARPGVWYSAGHGGHGLGTTAMLGELFARAVVDGDDAYRVLSPFGLTWAGGVFGLATAQLMYGYYTARDALSTWSAPWRRIPR